MIFILEIFNRDSNIVDILLKYKADIDLKDGDGSTALHYGIYTFRSLLLFRDAFYILFYASSK